MNGFVTRNMQLTIRRRKRSTSGSSERRNKCCEHEKWPGCRV